MPLRVLFADDQLPSPNGAENEQTRNEIRRELGGAPGIKDIDAAFDEDFLWFESLLDYLEKTKHVHVIRARSFNDAGNRIDRPEDFDVAIIDLSWWGDASLPPGRQHRHNRGLALIERIAERRRTGGVSVPTIALSQNFRDDFELMSTVLEMDALPIPKSYDKEGLGHRALFSAIQHLARLHPASGVHPSQFPPKEQGHVKLFISHAHRDMDLAQPLVEAIEFGMEVPAGAIRCTSVPGYKLDLGSMAPDALRRELSGAQCVVALLTPNSLASEWCQFELGAAWVLAKEAIPVLAGGLREADIPGAFRGAVGGRLDDPSSLLQLLHQVRGRLGWRERAGTALAADNKIRQLAVAAASKSFSEDDVKTELTASFTAKLARIGQQQAAIVHYITHNRGHRPYIPQEELYREFEGVQTRLYYRLEQLRYLGFLSRQQIGTKAGRPEFGWALSSRYQAEIV